MLTRHKGGGFTAVRQLFAWAEREHGLKFIGKTQPRTLTEEINKRLYVPKMGETARGLAIGGGVGDMSLAALGNVRTRRGKEGNVTDITLYGRG